MGLQPRWHLTMRNIVSRVQADEDVWVARWVAQPLCRFVSVVGAAGFEPATTCAQGGLLASR